MPRSSPFRILHFLALAAFVAAGLTSCQDGSCFFGRDARNKMVVSVADQKMMLLHDGVPVKTYKVSTSKFGCGDKPGSNRTPLGRLQIAKKIGESAPIGAVFKNRRPTGEVLKPNAPGRDPVVTRILWLKGVEPRNHNAFQRTIYIHGTPEEYRLGSPASYGCIRMASNDVADLFKRVGHGADVFVTRNSLKTSSSNHANLAQNSAKFSR